MLHLATNLAHPLTQLEKPLLGLRPQCARTPFFKRLRNKSAQTCITELVGQAAQHIANGTKRGSADQQSCEWLRPNGLLQFDLLTAPFA
jgi:hypothetical protein